MAISLMGHSRQARTYRLEKNLPIPHEDALRRLSAAMDEERWWTVWFDFGKRPFAGKVRGRKFHIRKRHNYRNAFVPVLYGEVQRTPTGSKLIGQFRLHTLVRWFLTFWYSFLVLVPLGLLAESINAGVHRFTADDLFPLLVWLVMLLFPLILVQVGQLIARGDRESIRRLLDELFADAC